MNTETNMILTSEFGTLAVEIDTRDGSPTGIRRGAERVRLSARVEVVSGGDECRGATGGLEYPDADVIGLQPGTVGEVTAQVSMDARTFAIPVRAVGDDWDVVWHYRLQERAPSLSVSLEVRPRRAGVILRNLHLFLHAQVADRSQWRVQAPGNKLRPDLPLSELSYPTTIQTIAGVEGSIGVIALERVGTPATLVIWPLARQHYGEMVLAPASDGVEIEWRTDVAGAPSPQGSLTAGPLTLDLLALPFGDVLARVPDMLAEAGIASPASPPDWAADLNLYEVQIGFGVFRDGAVYQPYPTAHDLLQDVDRIAGLGYTCLQLMPRQPYPSYNVHDYDDISTSYGDEEVVRQIIDHCHARGMRVILDILMHGVIDNEALDAAIAAIDAGPFISRLGEPTPDITTLERDEMDHVQIAWTRHVKDFEPYWRAGSLPRHPLVDEHPEWFTRDSSGAITGTYTQGFDLAHPGFQDYFVDKAVGLMQRLGIDGYRLDAPSYHAFMNWSERTRSNAAASMLGCLPLFAKLRRAMKAANPQSLLYTEPCGCLYRQHVDLVYNYDEQWLLRAVMESGSGKAHWVRNARELGQWIAQRDAALPRGALTAHHVDSHDSYWWPDPGHKWRREQYGTPAVAALMATFFLSGGPYMTYAGGEAGIEEQVRVAAALRKAHPNFASGRSDYASVSASHADVYAVIRESDAGRGLLLVNLSPSPVTTEVTVAGMPHGPGPEARLTTGDLLGGEPLTWVPAGGDARVAQVRLEAFGAVAVDLAPSARVGFPGED